MRKIRREYNLDALLRAKRAEKPAKAFWAQFDRELRTKQRRLLQKEPVEDLGSEVAPWRRLRAFAALCAASASCGVVGFVVMQFAGARLVETSSPPVHEVALTKALTDSNPAVESEASTHSPEPAFFEVVVDLPEPSHIKVEQTPSQPSSSQQLASASSLTERSLPDLGGFTLEMGTPFESMNIEEAIAFYAEEKTVPDPMEKYTHPLSDRGWSFTQYIANQKDPLNRVSAMALENKLFSRSSRSDKKLNALTLKF